MTMASLIRNQRWILMLILSLSLYTLPSNGLISSNCGHHHHHHCRRSTTSITTTVTTKSSHQQQQQQHQSLLRQQRHGTSPQCRSGSLFSRSCRPGHCHSSIYNSRITRLSSTAAAGSSSNDDDIVNNNKDIDDSTSSSSSSSNEVGRRNRDTTIHWWSDFKYGVHTVYENYLDYVWEYCIVRSIKYIAPLILAVILGQIILGGGNNNHNLLYLCVYYPMASATIIATSIGKILHIPTDCLLWIIYTIPKLIISSLGYLPGTIALKLIGILLPIQNVLLWILTNPFIELGSFLVGQPIMDELHYRYFLDKLLVGGQSMPNLGIGGGIGSRLYTAMTSMMITKKKDGSTSTGTTTETVQVVQVDDTSNGNGESKGELSPSTKKSDNDSKKSAIVVASSENRKRFQKVSSGLVLAAARRRPNISLTPQNLCVWISSFLIATCHLGWLRTPDDYFLSGFITSAMAHLSDLSFAEVQPILSTIFLTMALHQALVTWLISSKVFASIYQQRGIFASMGAHAMWSVGIIVLPFRLASKSREYFSSFRQQQKRELPSLPW